MTRLALLSLALAACGGQDLTIPPTAKVEGPFVVVSATCNVPSVRIDVSGVSGECAPHAPALVRVPAQGLGGGPKTLVVTASGIGKTATAEVTVDVPASALGPYFEVSACARELEGEFVTVEAGGRTLDDCKTAGGARVKLAMQASPNAKLTIGGKPVSVPDSGRFDHVVDLGEGILALSLDDLTSMATTGPKLVVPWTLDAGGKRLEGTIATSAKFGHHDQLMWQWLRDVADGKVERPRFAPRTEGRRTAIRVPAEKFAKLATTDRRGTVREVGLIAIEREQGRTKGGTCEFMANNKRIVAARYGIDLEVKLVATADGKPVETKVFPPPAGCPDFAMLDPKRAEVAVRVREADVMAWIETHTAESAGDAPHAAVSE